MMKATIDKHQFKITVAMAVSILIFIIITTAQFATWKAETEACHNELDDRITHIGEKVVLIRADINALKEKANSRDVELATINTKLANIEALLLDIRTDLKDLK